jgi:hypothetical protein
MNTLDIIIQKIINKNNIIYHIEDKKNTFTFWSELHKNNELNGSDYSFKFFLLFINLIDILKAHTQVYIEAIDEPGDDDLMSI